MHKPITTSIHPEEPLFFSKVTPEYTFSSPFSLVRSPLEFSTFFPCQHDSFISQPNEECGNCKDCGVYLNKISSVYGLKTKKNSFKLDIASKPLFENLSKNLHEKPIISPSSSYYKNRSSLIDWIFEMAKKLDLSLNSAHLAIVYLDMIMSLDKEDLFPIHLFSSTSLLLAAKAIELDERIPFLPKLKKMVAPMYNNEDFKRTEREILNILDWNLQIPTFFDLLEFYMSQGLIFNNDEINGEEIQQNCTKTPSPNERHAYKEQKFASPFINNEKNKSFLLNSAGSTAACQFSGRIANEKKIYEVIVGMEKDMVKLAGLVVKDSQFYKWDMKVLAAGAVGFLRKINNIAPLWNNELENISLGIKPEQIQEIQDLFLNKFISYFDAYLFQSKQENLLREFQNMKLNKENTQNIPLLTLKKANTQEETTNKTLENNISSGFSGYLRSYTLGLEPENQMKNNPGMSRITRNYTTGGVYGGNTMKSYGGNYNYNNYNNFNQFSNGLSRNYEEFVNVPQQYILKDGENKLNICNNNGFKSYFQEKNSNNYTDINQLTRKIDDIYGKIFNNYPVTKKL